MPFIEMNNVRYHYELAGRGAPLLLLHGFTGSGANWQAHTPVLAAQFQVLAVDLMGHGQTDAPEDLNRYSMEHTADDLINLCDAVFTQPIHLLGYSMGGRLALYLALHYPQHVRSLILESASPGLADAGARQARMQQDEQLANRIEHDGIEAFVDYWERIPLFTSQRNLPDAIRQRLREQRLQNSPRGLANSLRGMGTGVQPPLWDQLPNLDMPTLLMAGELDTKFVEIARQMQVAIPSAQLALVPGAGHTIHLEAPDVYQHLLLQFLTGIA